MTKSYSTTHDPLCYVYFIQNTSGATKIGIAKNVDTRIGDLQVANPEELTVFCQVSVASKEIALMIENMFHVRYGEFLMRGEWYRVPDHLLIADIEFGVAFANAIQSGKGVKVRLPRPAPPVLVIPDTDDSEYELVQDDDELYPEAVILVRRLGKASVSLLQRRMRMGYNRAARMIDRMEQEGVIDRPVHQSAPRMVFAQSAKIIDFETAADWYPSQSRA